MSFAYAHKPLVIFYYKHRKWWCSADIRAKFPFGFCVFSTVFCVDDVIKRKAHKHTQKIKMNVNLYSRHVVVFDETTESFTMTLKSQTEHI